MDQLGKGGRAIHRICCTMAVACADNVYSTAATKKMSLYEANHTRMHAFPRDRPFSM